MWSTVLLLTLAFSAAKAQDPASDSTDAVAAIISYHAGFATADAGQIAGAVGHSLYMFNGRRSSDPLDWQAHQFLIGEEVGEWISFMLERAGPFENRFDFVHVSVSGDAALVVTSETGKNRFRAWSDQLVTWMLGRGDQGWRIVGFFIRDASNPGSG